MNEPTGIAQLGELALIVLITFGVLTGWVCMQCAGCRHAAGLGSFS